MISRILSTILRWNSAFQSRRRNWILMALGCRIEGYAWIQKVHIPRQWADIHIAAGAALDSGTTLICSGPAKEGKLSVGERVYINRNTIIDASESIEIQKDVMIGPNCYITDHDHEYRLGQAPGLGTLSQSPTRIEERVWIGASVTVLKGVTIGRDSIIGAASVVTKDIPPNSIAVGTPAKVLKHRDGD